MLNTSNTSTFSLSDIPSKNPPRLLLSNASDDENDDDEDDNNYVS